MKHVTRQRIGVHRWRRALGVAVATFVAAGLVPIGASAAPGDIDSAFGTGGNTVTDISVTDRVFHAAFDERGRILMAGATSSQVLVHEEDGVVLRYREDGVLDPSFGGDGVVVTDFGTERESIQVVVPMPDGRVIAAGARDVGGTSPDGLQSVLARYLPDGRLDPTFGAGGTVITGIAGIGVAPQSVHVYPDGSVLVAAWAFGTSDGAALFRYLPDGTLDPSFHGSGYVLAPLPIGGSLRLLEGTFQPDGAVVMVGDVVTASGTAMLVTRISADGSVDTSFGSGGTVSLAIGDRAWAFEVIVRPDGRIVAGGGSATGRTDDMVLVGLTSDGALDDSFGVGGIARTEAGGGGITGIDLDPEGRIVASARRAGNVLLARYLADGSLDPGFALGGISEAHITGDEFPLAVRVDAAGRIVVAGTANGWAPSDIFVARFRGGTAEICDGVDNDGNGMVDEGSVDTDADGQADCVDTDDDGDGLDDTRDRDALSRDADADGIEDGSDPDTVAAAVAALPAPALRTEGNRRAMLSRLEGIEALIAAGDEEGAVRELRNLRRRVDGCESLPIADPDDWVTSCPEQNEIRGLIDVLIANLTA